MRRVPCSAQNSCGLAVLETGKETPLPSTPRACRQILAHIGDHLVGIVQRSRRGRSLRHHRAAILFPQPMDERIASRLQVGFVNVFVKIELHQQVRLMQYLGCLKFNGYAVTTSRLM